MKYCIIVLDGMADRRYQRLENHSPMECAKIPAMNKISSEGRIGLVKTIPEDLPIESFVSMMSILGLDARKYYTGAAAWEANFLGITLQPNDWAFCCDFVSNYDGILLDPCVKNLSTEEAHILLQDLANHFQEKPIQFFPWKGNHHLVVIHEQNFSNLKTISPFQAINKPLKYNYPQNTGSQFLIELMENSRKILNEHEVNKVRQDLKETPANSIWLWGNGQIPFIPSFFDTFGLQAGIISSNLATLGLTDILGIEIVSFLEEFQPNDVEYFSNLKDLAISSLRELDLLVIHNEFLVDISRKLDPQQKIRAIEELDDKLIAPMFTEFEQDYQLMIVGGYQVFADDGLSYRDAVPFAIYNTEHSGGSELPFNESTAKSVDFYVPEGKDLLSLLLKKR